MKAKDYFEKYGRQVHDEAVRFANNEDADGGNILSEMFFGFVRETKDIIAKRNAKNDDAIYSVIFEQNQKWNTLCRIFEKEYGESVLAENALMTWFKEKIPELQTVEDIRKRKKGVKV